MSRDTLIRGYLNGTLSKKRSDDLWNRARRDPDLRCDLDSALRIESMLCGDKAAPISHMELERIEDRVLTAVGKTTATKTIALGKWAFALGVAAVALLLLPLWWWLGKAPSSSTQRGDIPAEMFTPRGSEAPYKTHLFLFCVADRDTGVDVHRLDRPGKDAVIEQCPLQAEFQFALTNLGETYSYLYVFGNDDSGRRLWYFPKPNQGESRPIPTDVSEMLLGDSVVLDINHRAGSVRVVAVFSAEPLPDAEIEDAIQTLRDEAVDPRALLRGPKRYVEGYEINIVDEGDAQ